MKFFSPFAVFLVLCCVLLAGCTSTPTPDPVPATAVPTTTAVLQAPHQVLTPAPQPYPNALSLGQYVNFGNGDTLGKATVYRYTVKPSYDWVDPSWNSPREQLAASPPLDLQEGYNRESPKPGNTFLFLFVRVQNTGTKSVNAPSPKQFVVAIDGKVYDYSSVHGSEVIISNVGDSQYLYQRGQRDPIEYIVPGDNSLVEGYLIYEIPAPFSPDKTYVLSSVDYKNQAVWKLV